MAYRQLLLETFDDLVVQQRLNVWYNTLWPKNPHKVSQIVNNQLRTETILHIVLKVSM